KRHLTKKGISSKLNSNVIYSNHRVFLRLQK
ncbi:MAG: hypothetical protein ACI81G_001525, partial [Gammaproteobacteria bacterium]